MLLVQQIEEWALQLYRRPHLPKGIPERTLILLHTLFERVYKSGEGPWLQSMQCSQMLWVLRFTALLLLTFPTSVRIGTIFNTMCPSTGGDPAR